MFETLAIGAVYMCVFLSLYFQVFLLVTFFENRDSLRREENDSEPNYYPSVSVIVPCFNEESTVENTVNSIFALDYPKDKLKIILVDDGSTDGTWGKILRFKNRAGVEIIRKENGGKHTALNIALLGVKTELVGCLDADSFVSPSTLKRIVKHFEDKTVMAVTPSIKLHDPKNIIELVQNVEYSFGIFFRKMLGFASAIQITPGPFSIFRKKVFDDLGPYRKAHGTEDMEIALRMHEAHYRITNAHKAFVATVAPKTLGVLYRQRLRWVYGFLQNSLDYKHLFLNKKYGAFGVVVLPFAIVSVFSTLYLFGYMVFRLGVFVFNKILQIEALGFSSVKDSFNLFYINTESLLILSVILGSLAIFMIFLGKMFAEDRRLPIDIIYFLLLYGLIVPLWLSMALVRTITSRSPSWR